MFENALLSINRLLLRHAGSTQNTYTQNIKTIKHKEDKLLRADFIVQGQLSS